MPFQSKKEFYLHEEWSHCFFFLFFSFLFYAAPVAYGSSRARGRIGAASAGLGHSLSNARVDLHCSLWQHQILNPLNETRDQTCTSSQMLCQVPNLVSNNGISFFFFFLSFSHFLDHSYGIWRFPGYGSNRSCSHQPTPEPQQCGV